MQTTTSNLNTQSPYTYTVIFARYNSQWLYCRHKTRNVFETAGGHIEPGETPQDAARRELYEETGAICFDITPAFDYSVSHEDGDTTHGQLFYAEINSLDSMPDFEMAEVGLFDTLPDNMRFPQITPILFARLQEWLYARAANEELLDVYDANRKLTGKTRRRGEPPQPGEYNLVVLVCLMNSNGQFLITKRAPNKSYAGMREFQGGCAVAGDDSRTAAVREVKEEAGLDLRPDNGELVFSRQFKHSFYDVWLYLQDFDIKDVALQPGETVDAKLATMDEIRDILNAYQFVPDDFIEGLFEKAENRLSIYAQQTP